MKKKLAMLLAAGVILAGMAGCAAERSASDTAAQTVVSETVAEESVSESLPEETMTESLKTESETDTETGIQKPETDAEEIKVPETAADQAAGIGSFVITDAESADAETALFAQTETADSVRIYKITALKDTGHFALTRTGCDADGNRTDGEVLFEADAVSAGQYIYLTDMIPEGFPSLLIAWEDENGLLYERYISESGMDGSLLLISTDDSGIREAAMDANALEAALDACTGWGGDAGSSMKCAAAAVKLLSWAMDNPVSSVTENAIRVKFDEMDEAAVTAFMDNWPGIMETADTILNDMSSVTGVLDDAGILDAAKEAAEGANTYDRWEMLKAVIENITTGSN